MFNSYLPAGPKRGLHESEYTFICVLHTSHACDKNSTPHHAYFLVLTLLNVDKSKQRRMVVVRMAMEEEEKELNR
jgi:hypothetical protein